MCVYCRYGYTEVPDQGHAFVETLLLTMLKKLYTELHTVIQSSEDLSKRFPALAQEAVPYIPAVATTAAASLLGPVQPPSPREQAKPLIKKALQMTGDLHGMVKELSRMFHGHCAPQLLD